MIVFPSWVRPATPCTRRSYTDERFDRHGVTWWVVTVIDPEPGRWPGLRAERRRHAR